MQYGLIYHASLVGASAPKFKGKISRVLAAKCSLSIRVDALGDGAGATIGIEDRAKARPPPRRPRRATPRRARRAAALSGRSAAQEVLLCLAGFGRGPQGGTPPPERADAPGHTRGLGLRFERGADTPRTPFAG